MTDVSKEGLEFDPEALHAKYLAERDKRLRADGIEQYIPVSGEFAHFAGDPHTPRIARDPIERGEPKSCRDRRRLRRLADGRAPLKSAGVEDVTDPREGRRCRRHLVLEPLSRRGLRRGKLHLHPAAGGAAATCRWRSIPKRPEILEPLPKPPSPEKVRVFTTSALLQTEVKEACAGTRRRRAGISEDRSRRRGEAPAIWSSSAQRLAVSNRSCPALPGIDSFEGTGLSHQPLGLRAIPAAMPRRATSQALHG
jgi:hypothetical protein